MNDDHPQQQKPLPAIQQPHSPGEPRRIKTLVVTEVYPGFGTAYVVDLSVYDQERFLVNEDTQGINCNDLRMNQQIYNAEVNERGFVVRATL